CAVVSLVTAQNTSAVYRVETLAPELVLAELDAVLDDIRPFAIKTGALGSRGNVIAIATRLAGTGIPLVVDPVRIAKHGAALLEDGARSAVLERLLPLATLLTANAPEAAWLAEREVHNEDDVRAAIERLVQLGARAVLLKGGHLPGEQAVDWLFCAGELRRL